MAGLCDLEGLFQPGWFYDSKYCDVFCRQKWHRQNSGWEGTTGLEKQVKETLLTKPLDEKLQEVLSA